jgi:molecular chaperone GrpE
VLSKEDLMKLLVEKDELLEEKQKEFETMKDKLIRGYAEMENVMSRTKREADNSKKFAIQVLSLGFLHPFLFF